MVVVVNLPLLIDVITITAGIPVILVIPDNRADHPAQHAAHGRTCSGSDSRDDRTCYGSGSGADDRSGSAAGNYMIPVGVAGASAQGKAAHGNGGDKQAFHFIVLQGSRFPAPKSIAKAAMAVRDTP
jgi:hypothetical protein